jgi:hypothetical protein
MRLIFWSCWQQRTYISKSQSTHTDVTFVFNTSVYNAYIDDYECIYEVVLGGVFVYVSNGALAFAIARECLV